MPTNTYTPLGTITLSASASEVIFSGIPASLNGQSFRDLILVMAATGASGNDVNLFFNGDTNASNYSSVRMFGLGSSTGSSTYNSAGSIYTSLTQTTWQIMDYSATDKHKSQLIRVDNAGNATTALARRWANTSAITSATVQAVGTTFTSGSTFSLYAIAG